MSARLPFRISTLLFAALVWAATPRLLTAGPGPGGGQRGGGGGGGSHGGGGGSHGGGGGGSHGGGGHASGATGHVSSPSYGGASYNANRPSGGSSGHAQQNFSAPSGAGAGQQSLSSFASSSESAAQRGAAAAELSRLAAHGWNFTPSSGVTRPVAPLATRIPAIRPFPGPFDGRRIPYATGMIIPGAGIGFGGYPCPRRPGFGGCGFGFGGYGFGYGYGYGYGYGLGYGLGYGGYGLYDLPAEGYYPPDNGSYMDLQQGYIAEPGGTVPLDVNAGPPNPDEIGPEATPQPPTQIILKDGSAYAVKSYWVSNGQLYYQPVTGGLSHVSVDQLDLAATVAANSRNGVPFTISDRPPHD